MSTKKRVLGRGLNALLGNRASVMVGADSDIETEKEIAQNGELRQISIDLIRPGKYQPRTHMAPEALEELADSIRTQGVMQPIILRAIGEKGHFEIVAGERRWRAAQIAELQEIPAIVREVSDEDAIAMALIENIQREDLSPLEEAVALDRLIKEFAMTHQQAGDAVGRSRASVSNLLRMLDLEPLVKEALDRGELEMGHARALLALMGSRQINASRKIIDQQLSVRQTEQLVRHLLSGDDEAVKKIKPSLDPDIRRLQESLSEKLGAKVELQHGKGKGKLVIAYNSLDELDGILEHIH